MSQVITRFFLARHGNTFNVGETPVMVGSKTDLPLTPYGHEQAQGLATYFKDHNIYFDRVYCGSLRRQKETAAALSDTVIANVAALDEIDYGQWEGLSDEAIKAKWPQEFEAFSHQGVWPKVWGSSFEDKKMLLKDWISTLAAPGETILAVSSGGIARLALSLIPDAFKEKDFKAYKVATGRFCELALSSEGLKIIRWNENPN